MRMEIDSCPRTLATDPAEEVSCHAQLYQRGVSAINVLDFCMHFACMQPADAMLTLLSDLRSRHWLRISNADMPLNHPTLWAWYRLASRDTGPAACASCFRATLCLSSSLCLFKLPSIR